MSTEAVDRNNALQFIHNVKLPSYAVWDPDSIMDTMQTINLDWWININKIYIKKNTKNDTVKNNIRKWIEYYKNIIEHPNEYCSKRMGDYLNCDI